MEKRELRIGNFVNCNGIVSEIVEIRNNYVRLKYFREDVNKEHISIVQLDDRIKEIPLSEEWLLKLGYLKEDENFIAFGHFISGYGSNFFSCKRSKVTLLYIHQLQNLYYELIGKELTIKNN